MLLFSISLLLAGNIATKLVFALSKASDLYPDALSESGLFALTLPARKPPHCSVRE